MNEKILTLLIVAFFGLGNVLSAAESRHTQLTVEKMHSKGCAQKIASQLYTVRGVKSVSVSVDRKTLYVTPVQDREVSLWALWEAVDKADNRALDIRGPTGSLKDVAFAARRQRSPKTVR